MSRRGYGFTPSACCTTYSRLIVAPASGAPMRDYLVAVALAVRHGLPSAAALRAVERSGQLDQALDLVLSQY